MTSAGTSKIVRASGTFVPDPKIVGRLLGFRCRNLHQLAQSIDDGVYIRYDFDALRFDISANSVTGVQATIDTFKSRQVQFLLDLISKTTGSGASGGVGVGVGASIGVGVGVGASIGDASGGPPPLRPVSTGIPSLTQVAGPIPIACSPMVTFDQNGNRIPGVFRLQTSMQVPDGWQIQSAQLTVFLVSTGQGDQQKGPNGQGGQQSGPNGQGGPNGQADQMASNWAKVASSPVVHSTSMPAVSIGKAHPALSAPKSPLLGKPVTAKSWGEMMEQVDQGAVMPSPEVLYDISSDSSSDVSDDEGWIEQKQ